MLIVNYVIAIFVAVVSCSGHYDGNSTGSGVGVVVIVAVSILLVLF